jgi:C-terminal processing protease CtpA/Prc
MSLDVSTLTRVKRFEILTERYETFPKTRDDMWKFEVLSDNTAILTLNSFGLNGWKAMTIDYKAFLADAFKEIRLRKIEHLIIDIRENNGGNDEMADELFSYFTQDDFQFEREGRTRYVHFPETLKPHIRTWGDNPWYYNLNPKNPEPQDGYYIFKENFSSQPSGNTKKIYKGKSYLLISSANTSLAFYTAYRFKNQNIGNVIGRETGGNLNDINGGQIIFLTLPNSGIEIDFPVMGGFSITNQPNTGVQPDIMVEYNTDDIINQSDLELKKTLELIKKYGTQQRLKRQ